MICQYELGEGYKKLLKRFEVSISTVRNVVRRRTVRIVTDKPQITSKELQKHLAAESLEVCKGNKSKAIIILE